MIHCLFIKSKSVIVRSRCRKKRDLFAYVFVEVDPCAIEIGKENIVFSQDEVTWFVFHGILVN